MKIGILFLGFIAIEVVPVFLLLKVVEHPTSRVCFSTVGFVGEGFFSPRGQW